MNTVKYVSIGDHVKAVLNSRLNMNTLKNETPVYTFKVTEIHETYGYRIVNGKKELNTPVISGIPLNDETKNVLVIHSQEMEILSKIVLSVKELELLKL